MCWLRMAGAVCWASHSAQLLAARLAIVVGAEEWFVVNLVVGMSGLAVSASAKRVLMLGLAVCCCGGLLLGVDARDVRLNVDSAARCCCCYCCCCCCCCCFCGGGGDGDDDGGDGVGRDTRGLLGFVWQA